DIFQKFVDAGYIKAYQKGLIVKELTNIESELEDIEEQDSNLKEYRAASNYDYGQTPQDLSQLILTDLWAKNGLEEKYGNIIECFERLNSDDLKEVLDMSRSDHQIQTVLNTLSSDSNRSYDKNGDMILTGTGEIKVNMSAAMRMYEEGQSLLEDKEEKIKKLEAAVEREIKDYSQRKKREVLRKIDDIEAEPKAYSFLLTKHLPILGMN